MENNKFIEPVEIGNFVIIGYENGCRIAGILMGISQQMDMDGKKHIIYRVIVGKTCMDILQDDISDIRQVTLRDNDKFIKKMKDKFEIDLLDVNGNYRNTPDIVNEALVKGAWDMMSDEDKNELVDWLDMDIDTNVDLISALDMSRKRNNELHQKIMDHLNERIKLKNMAVDFQKNWDEMENQMPESFRWAYDFIYKYFGIEDLIREI